MGSMLPHLVPQRGCATNGTESEHAPSMQALTMCATSATCGSNTWLVGFEGLVVVDTLVLLVGVSDNVRKSPPRYASVTLLVGTRKIIRQGGER